MEFEEFAQLCHDDVERFRDQFGTMFDTNGTAFSTTVGFHFSLEEPEELALTLEMLEIFQPVAVWVGYPEGVAQLQAAGHQALLFPWFEHGGFMVVLKVPAVPGE